MTAEMLIEMIGFISLPVLGFLVYWLLALQNALSDYKLDVANNYAKKDDLNIALNKIEAILERIFTKLDVLSARVASEHKGQE